jgi:hypothetical protein
MKHSTIWINKGWQNVFIGFCPSERAWNKTMKEIGATGTPYPKVQACCTSFTSDTGRQMCIVTLHESIDNAAPIELIGLLVHECVHVKQRVMEIMGETKVGEEHEAYTVQAIFQMVLDAFEDTRHKLVLEND